MLEIDGSYGEGGGQILRTAVALSALNNIPIKIINIRANRPDPGIKPQHYVAIKSVKELCNAETTGLEVGSSSLIFTPGEIKGGTYKFDIGTAGSMVLVFQTCILASLKSKESMTIKLRGGSDVKWAPSWDYFYYVFLPLIKKIGIKVDAKLTRRGYYPIGGGEAEITINPNTDIKQLKFNEKQIFSDIKGIIHVSGLPEHISTRIKHAAIKELLKNNFKADIKIEQTTSSSPGTGLTLWVESKDTVLGSTVLGERGITSEQVGQKAANNILNEIISDANLDVHAFDQLLPYMVIPNKKDVSSYVVRELSSHASTNIWVLKQFFKLDFKVTQNEKNVTVKINKNYS